MGYRVTLGIVATFFAGFAFYFFRGYPLYYITIFTFCSVLSSLLLVFIFIEKTILMTWIKVSFVPAILLVSLSLEATYELGGSFFPPPNPFWVSWFFAGTFLILSLIVIAWKSWKLRKKDSTRN